MRIPFMSLRVAVGSALVCTLTALPAHGDEAVEKSASTRIPTSRYPSVEAVARLFPDYRGGRREIYGGRQLSLTSDDCRGVDMASTQPRAGGFANYTNRAGQSPYFSGGTSAGVALYDFRKPKRAQAALDEERDTIRSCYGPNFDGDGYGTTYRRLASPNLADDQFAYRQINHDVNTGTTVVTILNRTGLVGVSIVWKRGWTHAEGHHTGEADHASL